MSANEKPDFTLGYYSGDRKTGSVAVVRRRNGEVTVKRLRVDPETGLDKLRKPVFVGVTPGDKIILLDPSTRKITIQDGFPADAFPAHIYSEADSSRDWFMNDGEKETGNDTVNCGDKGSSVSIVDNTASADATFVKTICIGRGHHQATFFGPSAEHPAIARRAVISNLVDGTLSVIGNDRHDTATYLQVVATINLGDATKEQSGRADVPNNAFPHGLVFSRASGKLYCLNNGYGTIAVIDPLTNTIETVLPFKGHSNLFAAPGGRYLIGRGADRKSDPAHVIAKVSVFDTATHEIVESLTLPDIYLSKYFFNPEGTKLYFTTASSGSPEQQQHLKADALLVYDVSALPTLRSLTELRLGAAVGTLDFKAANGVSTLVFTSNSEQGAVGIIDAQTDEMIEQIPVVEGSVHSRLWTLPE